MKKLLLLYTLLLLAAYSGAAAAGDTLAVTEHLSVWNRQNAQQNINPAFRGVAYAYSFSQLGCFYDYNHQQQAYILQKGNGHSLLKIKGDSYKHLDKKQTVWGDASYTSGIRKNVKWNSTADYELLYPYILADSLGGNLTTEQYAFGGGYATRIASKVTLGLELRYRSEHEYRMRDPRPRSIVSDLSVMAGVQYNLSTYLVGAAVGFTRYKQIGSVAFYSEAGGISEYLMTGLGTIYERFTGNSAMLYDGEGWKGEVALAPAQPAGWFMSCLVSRNSYRRIITSLNSLPLTTLYVSVLSAQGGWRSQARYCCSVALGADASFREGVEHIAGDGEAAIFPIIGHLSMYENTRRHIYARAMFGQPTGVWGSWYLSAQLGGTSHAAKYRYPQRTMDLETIYAGVELQVAHPVGQKQQLSWNGSGYYYGNVKSGLDLPLATDKPALAHMMTYSFRYYSASYTVVSANMRSDWRLRKSDLGLFAVVGGRYIQCSVSSQSTSLILSGGITF